MDLERSGDDDELADEVDDDNVFDIDDNGLLELDEDVNDRDAMVLASKNDLACKTFLTALMQIIRTTTFLIIIPKTFQDPWKKIFSLYFLLMS